MSKDKRSAIDLVKLLGGLPLAIKLAALMIKNERRVHVKFAEVLTELQNREEILALEGSADESSSLRAILGMSYDRLPDKIHKRGFRWLAAFGSESFAWEAVEKLWKMKKPRARKIMSTLINRALVESNEKTERFQLHAVLAKFAESLLEQKREASRTYRAHSSTTTRDLR